MEKKDIFDRIMDLECFSVFRPIYKKHKEVLMYLFFGGLTTVVSIVVFAIFVSFLNPLIANIISWIIAVSFAYLTNRTWVFESNAGSVGEIVRECGSFFGGRVATLVLEEVILFVGITILGINTMIVKIVAQVLVVVGNYFISKLFVFK